MLFMVIEHFGSGGGATEVYERHRTTRRQLPEGLTYIDSWVSADLERCFQLMECDDAEKLQAWAAQWTDLVAFEFVPVTSSTAARELFNAT
ncbi:MAG: DUF3303 family protein [Alphaproteobacteria bacterium]|nr:DUF3303 family protein [Alphaproteobacteria bacterium]